MNLGEAKPDVQDILQDACAAKVPAQTLLVMLGGVIHLVFRLASQRAGR